MPPHPIVPQKGSSEDVKPGVFICTLDDMHAEIIIGLAPLNLHLMSEKPLATTPQDCLRIYRSLQPSNGELPTSIVLHYSPHNVLLRKLLLEDCIIGEILSIEHTEPVGWWHFSHSYVRNGNWRKESVTAPSLLTISCHDIDYLLWLLCSPPTGSSNPPHLPKDVSSTGSLKYFKRSRKPELAGNATSCLSCPAESVCMYSAKKIYHEKFLASGNAGWPVHIVDPEIEDLLGHEGMDSAARHLRARLQEDYEHQTDPSKIERRPWFGRCVYGSDNDVCDGQVVTINWDDSPLPHDKHLSMSERLKGRGAKTATFHMIAQTEKQCERRGRVYGSKGEIEYEGKMIRVYEFGTSKAQVHHPHQAGGGHGGGDEGLTRQFIRATEATERNRSRRDKAQKEHIGCTLEDIIRSHAMVFAAEEARRDRKVIDWAAWWQEKVVPVMQCPKVFGGGHSVKRSAIYGGVGVARSALSSTLDRLCLHIHANSHQDRKEHSGTATEAWNDQRSGWYGFELEDGSRAKVDSFISIPSCEFQDMQSSNIQLVGHRVVVD